MADQDWIRIPMGCVLTVATAGTDAYLTDAVVQYVMKTGQPPAPDFGIAKSSLDPGPVPVPIAYTGAVGIILHVRFVKPSATTVTATFAIKAADGSDLVAPFVSALTGTATDGPQTVTVAAVGEGTVETAPLEIGG